MTNPQSSPQSVGVLALQGDFREHCAMLSSLGHHAYEVRKPGELDHLDALIIPGGESTTIARLIIGNGFQQPLRDFCDSGRPVWGTCAGAILLARHVDNLDRPGIETMNIRVRRNAFGRQADSFEANLDIKGIDGPPFHAVFIRAPIIEDAIHPAGAIARLEDGTIVAAREDNLLATSFHPELTGDARLHKYFLSIGRPVGSQSLHRRREGDLPEGLRPFLDPEGRLTQWPVKQSLQQAFIAHLSTSIERGQRYSEAELNRLLETRHTFRDAALLRRLLYEWGHLDRKADGSAYWLREPAGNTPPRGPEALSR